MSDMKSFVNGLNWRYATKGFDATKKLSEDQLAHLKNCLVLSPSSYGLQPWKFICITENKELREKLRACAWNQPQITDASSLFVLCARHNTSKEDVSHYIDSIAKTRGIPSTELEGYRQMMEGAVVNLSPENSKQWGTNQVYIALGVLLSASANSKIDACPMEGFDRAQFDEILGLSGTGYFSAVLCAVGFRSEDDKYAGLKKVRFSESELIETR